MNDDVPPHSGYRWEPAGGPFPRDEARAPDPVAAQPRAPRRRRRSVTTGLGLVLVGAAGGFALGPAAGQDGVRVGTTSVTVPQGGDGSGWFQGGDDGGSSGDGSA